MTLGKSIRIYLKEGNVSGIKLAEVVNLTIQALSCPRNKLSDLNNYFSDEANKPGVYFLLGTDDETNNAKVYIGEAENVWKRLKNHDLNKDFWNEVILFTSKDENLTKSHVKYLESRLINIAIDADRYEMENSNSPFINSLPLPDKDAMEEFINNLKILNGTLGHKFLESMPILSSEASSINSIAKKSNTEGTLINSTGSIELQFKVKNIKAKAIQTDEGIFVLKGSMVSNTVKETLHRGYKTLRENLIKNGTIVKEGDKMYFAKGYLFNNPSPAAAVIMGYPKNGRTAWKDNNGASLKEIEANKINEL
jgi:hypothetical protein